MKLLLDHNLDWRLKRYLIGHDVSTVQERDWADVINGDLLALAENAGFKVLLTADSNIKQQQNMSGRSLAVIILRAGDNRLATHRQIIAKILLAIDQLEDGMITRCFTPM